MRRSLTLSLVLVLSACRAGPSESSPAPAASSARVVSEPPAFFWSSWEGMPGFYRWDGTLLKPWNTIAITSPDGRYYVDDYGRIWARGYGQVGSVPSWPDWTGSWAGDGNYLCGLAGKVPGPYNLQITDLDGASRSIPLNVTGADTSLMGCSREANRAVVLNRDVFTVRSLTDGHVERTIDAPTGGAPVSADLRWIVVAFRPNANSNWEGHIISLADGTVQATIPNPVPAFFPDGEHAVVDERALARSAVIDWRTGKELWSGSGGPEVEAVSDLTTDKMLLGLVTGSAEFGTPSRQFWIVDGNGNALQFAPPAVASGARTAA